MSQNLANTLAHGKTITLILAEGDPTVAATWAGLKAASGHKAPALIFKVVK